jgi:hypothetical protein
MLGCSSARCMLRSHASRIATFTGTWA